MPEIIIGSTSLEKHHFPALILEGNPIKFVSLAQNISNKTQCLVIFWNNTVTDSIKSITETDGFFFYLAICVFSQDHSRITGLKEKREGIFLTPQRQNLTKGFIP